MFELNKFGWVGLLLLVALMHNNAQAAEFGVQPKSIDVKNVAELRTALKFAHDTKTPSVINLADGIYKLTDKPIRIAVDNITIRSASGIREKVIITGESMNAGLGVLVDVAAQNFTLAGVTLKNARWHLIQVRAESDADFFHLENSVLLDAGEQHLKVSHVKDGPFSDYGTVKNSLFDYTAGIGPQWYIGGIDAHHSVNWLVEGNTFRNIASPADQVAEHAVHFWRGSKDNKTLNNVIINCDRGIGYGLLDEAGQNEGGIISNNVIIHTESKHPFSDVGIGLESSPNTIVSNNIIFSTNNYPNAIEYRFKRTTGALIMGNITNKAIKARNGAKATLSGNKSGGVTGQVIDNVQYLLNKR
jgi:hypothetical protein